MPTNDVADRLRAGLTGTPGVVSAYLFGSAASARTHKDSDLDVAVLLDREAYPTAADRFEVRLSLISALGRATAGEIDLVVLNDAPPHLARRIMTEGRRLLAADAGLDRAHLRVVLSRAADLEPFLRRARAIKLQVIAP